MTPCLSIYVLENHSQSAVLVTVCSVSFFKAVSINLQAKGNIALGAHLRCFLFFLFLQVAQSAILSATRCFQCFFCFVLMFFLWWILLGSNTLFSCFCHLCLKTRLSMQICCVPLCKSDSCYKKIISFHAFPSVEKRRAKWV